MNIGATSNPLLRVVISGNGYGGALSTHSYGVADGGLNTRMSNTVVGLDITGMVLVASGPHAGFFGNGAGGYWAAPNAENTTIIGSAAAPTVIAGNGFPRNPAFGDGVLAEGTHFSMDGVFVGVAADGQMIIPNSRRGINARQTSSTATPLVVRNCKIVGGGSTAPTDPQFGGPAASVSVHGFTATISSCVIGATNVSAQGGAGGIVLQATALGSTIENTVIGGVSGDAPAAVVISAGNTQVLNSCVGVAPSVGVCQGAAGAVAYTVAPNGGVGIRVERSATHARVIDTVVSNSGSDGIYTSAVNVTLSGNVIGFTPGSQQLNNSNHGYGVRVDDNVPGLMTSNTVEFSKFLGVRMDVGSNAYVEGITSGSVGNNVISSVTNEWGSDACLFRCACEADTLSTTVNAIAVNCTMVDWGVDFPTNLPPTTTTLLLSGPNTNLKVFRWNRLDGLAPRLERLDAHRNPDLSVVPVQGLCAGGVAGQCSLEQFDMLRELSIDFTNLGDLTANTLQPLRARLDTLSAVSDQPPPTDVSVNMTGFGRLRAIPWFSPTRCPQGFYSTKLISDPHRLCFRCPFNTYNNASGATSITDCVSCPPNTYDLDDDPSTPCTAAVFRTSALWESHFLTHDVRANYTVNETFSIAAVLDAFNSGTGRDDLTLADLFDGVSDVPSSELDGVDGIRFELNMFVSVGGGSFAVLPTSNATVFVDSRTGAATMMFPVVSRGIFAQLVARDASQTTAVVKSWTFDALLPDTALASNGPNGVDCNSIGQRVDIIPLDNSYTCLCDDNSGGDNCEESLASSVVESDAESKRTMYIIVAVCATVLILCVLYARRRINQEKMKNENMKKLQMSILEKFGLAGVDMGESECAIIIRFDGLSLDADSSAAVGFCNNVRTHLAKRYAEDGYTEYLNDVHLTNNEGACLVKFAGQIKEEAGEDVIGEICVDIEKFPIEIYHERGMLKSGRCFVAVSLRPPREIEKKSVMRLEAIGKGAFGEVYRGLLREPHRGVPSSLVAMKMMNSAGQAAREELLKEAALMGAFAHGNIVNVIGVVTVPRDLPAVLLMEYCEHGSLLSYLIDSDAAAEATIVDLMTFCSDIASGLVYLHRMRFVHRDIAARNVRASL